MKLRIEQLPVGQMQANCYLVIDEDSHQALIVDPGDDGQYIIDRLLKYALTPTAIIATHGHFDHIMAACELELSFGIPCMMAKEDQFLVTNMHKSAAHFLGLKKVDPPPVVTNMIEDKDKVSLGSHKFMVVGVPGHTPGSIAIVSQAEKWIIVGDLMFAGGAVGRTDFSYSDGATLARSIQKILSFPNDFTVYSGHGEPFTVEEFRTYHI